MTSVRAARGDEQGSSLLAVIGVMAVFAIISITIVASTMTTLGATTSTRAGVQAQAAAEAGIDATVNALTTTECSLVALSSSEADEALGVSFDIALAYQAPGVDGVLNEEWHNDCPSPDATKLRITSTGYAAAGATLGNTSGDVRTVEAIYLDTVKPIAIPSDIAVNSNSSIGFGGSSQVYVAGENVPSLYAKTGDISCNGSSIMRANVYVPDGIFTTGDSCQFFGSVHSAGAATLGGSSIIHGSLTAPTITTSGSSIVHGDGWALGAIDMTDSSQIMGDVVADSLERKLTSRVGGSVALSPASSRSLPAFPPPPEWIDLSYEKNDWSAYTTVVVSGTCTFAQLQPIVTGLKESSGLLDARGCNNGITSISSEILTLHNDLVIIANNVNLRGSAQFQAVAAGAKLWLIMPDETADGEPTCPAGSVAHIDDSFIAGTYVEALLYSPCDIRLGIGADSSSIWYGQMYGKTVTFGGSAILNHVPMTSPIDSAEEPGTPGTVEPEAFEMGTRQSIRDVN